MATPIKETAPKIIRIPSPEEVKRKYSEAELEIITKITSMISGESFHYLDRDTTSPEDVRVRMKEIISTLATLVTDIRLKKKPESELFDYQDLHFEDSDHAWLSELHPGLNINGWRVFMAEMSPLKFGQNVERPLAKFHSTFKSGK